MSRMLLLSVAICAAVAVAGCSSSSDSTGSSAGGPVPSDPIAKTVYDFLDAIRVGDTETSSSLLTPLALQRIVENDMSFAPPASENARFKVGKVDMFEADKAAVDSVWTDVDADGQPTKEPMTWALKLTDGQWRISGLIAYMGADSPPIVVDFENPDQLFGSSPQKTASQLPPQQPPQDGSDAPRQASQPTRDPFR